jgi:hypothetical protein
VIILIDGQLIPLIVNHKICLLERRPFKCELVVIHRLADRVNE